MTALILANVACALIPGNPLAPLNLILAAALAGLKIGNALSRNLES